MLGATHFGAGHYQNQPMSRAMGLLLLLTLSALQFAHFNWLSLDQAWVSTLPYRLILYLVAPTFYLFSQPLLSPQLSPKSKGLLLAHLLPCLLVPFLSEALTLSFAFIIGAGYLLWLAKSVYSLRVERVHFRKEMMLLGGIFIIAIGVSTLGLAQAVLPEKVFFSLYSIAIGLAFFLVQITLYIRPQLPAEVRETVLSNYASSTLNSVDCDDVLSRLNTLMQVEKIYEDSDVSLPVLAERLELSTHQLSELINTQLGKGFSRYLREQRVGAAATMLSDEPTASVLSVGLNVGFTSQSNFYQAFREIEGTTPGKYRKLHLKPSSQ